jgi:hypothetical protein
MQDIMYKVAGLAVLALLGACVSGTHRNANAPLKSSEAIALAIERWQQDIPLAKSMQSIHFENLHGNLVVKNGENGNVGIVAVEQRLGKKPEKAKVAMEQRGSDLYVSIAYPSDATLGADALVDGHLKGRVDLAVFVPKYITLNLRTSFGELGGQYNAFSNRKRHWRSNFFTFRLRSDECQ